MAGPLAGVQVERQFLILGVIGLKSSLGKLG